MRTQLTADQVFNVALSGNDANDGISAPKRTLAAMYNAIRDAFDLCGHLAVINITEAGTYDPAELSGPCCGQARRDGLLIMASVPSVTVRGPSGNAIYFSNGARAKLHNFGLESGGSGASGFGLSVENGMVEVGFLNFGSCPSGFLNADGKLSEIIVTGGMSISTSAQAALVAERGALISTPGAYIDVLGALNWAQGFLLADENAEVDVRGATIVNRFGPCTGLQAVASLNAVIAMNGVTVPGVGTTTGQGGEIKLN